MAISMDAEKASDKFQHPFQQTAHLRSKFDCILFKIENKARMSALNTSTLYWSS